MMFAMMMMLMRMTHSTNLLTEHARLHHIRGRHEMMCKKDHIVDRQPRSFLLCREDNKDGIVHHVSDAKGNDGIASLLPSSRCRAHFGRGRILLRGQQVGQSDEEIGGMKDTGKRSGRVFGNLGAFRKARHVNE